jgi:hypothetical protein
MMGEAARSRTTPERGMGEPVDTSHARSTARLGGYFEVRCCCDPAKLLGYVRTSRDVRVGTEVRFVLRPPASDRWRIGDPSRPVDRTPNTRLALPFLAWARSENGRTVESGQAFASRDTPIEVLRRIQSWVDA